MRHALSPQYFLADWLLPVDGPPVRHGFLRVEDGVIAAAGSIQDLPETVRETLPPLVRGSLITPGLVNTHVHLEQSFPEMIRKNPEATFEQWLFAVFQTLHGADTPEEKLARSRFGVEEALTTGTTCVNDICSGPESLTALDEAGLRGVVSPEFFHPGFEPPLQLEGPVKLYQALSGAYQAHPRLRVGLSPHAPYNVSPAAWHAMLEACKPALIHAHLAEFEDEGRYLAGAPDTMIHRLHQAVLKRTFAPQKPASSPTEYLHDFDLLTNRTVAAHGLRTSLTDRYQLASHRVAVAHCPRSNLHLHGHTLYWPDWEETALEIGLGTDGRLSTENLDLRAEARCAMDVHGWTAEKALRMMTLEGAKVMRLDATIGSLNVGKAADWVLWRAAGLPDSAPEAAVLDASTRVQAVYVDGVLRYQAAIRGATAV